ncbi:MAG: integrase core domain-containing protein [Bacteriovoracia bacterium]
MFVRGPAIVNSLVVCVWQKQFKNFEEAKEAVDVWVNFYNTERPHQTIGYETPERFYQSTGLRKIA